jgi:hypothetical protein
LMFQRLEGRGHGDADTMITPHGVEGNRDHVLKSLSDSGSNRHYRSGMNLVGGRNAQKNSLVLSWDCQLAGSIIKFIMIV